VISHFVESFFFGKKKIQKRKSKIQANSKNKINAVIYRRMINLTTIFGV